MGLPRAVREQAELSDKLIADSRAQAEQGKTGEASIVPNLEAVTGQKTPEQRPPERQAPEDAPKQDGDYRHKYEVLQAKYNAEVPMLYRQIKGLEKQVADLEGIKQRLELENKALNEQRKGVEDRDPSWERLVDELGEEAAEVVKRQSQQIAQLQAQIQDAGELKKEFATVRQTEAERRASAFWEEVHAIPSFEQVNPHPKFHQWLSAPNPGDTKTRQQLLEEAADALDVRRVRAIFDAFTSQNKVGPAVPNIEDRIVPDSGGGGGGGEPEKPVYSREWIQKFHADITKGRSPYTREQQAKIDRDIQVAQVEGRIR